MPQITFFSVATTPLVRRGLLDHSSDWNKVKRRVAWLLRLEQMLQQRAQQRCKTERRSIELSVEELQHAEEVKIKKVHQQAFPAEMTAPKKCKVLNQIDASCKKKDQTKRAEVRFSELQKKIYSKSPILNLHPVLQGGLLKVGGRLRAAEIPEHSKHQLILPRHHRVSELILERVRMQSDHQGRNYVLAVQREK